MDQPDLTDTSRLQQLYARRVTARGAGSEAGCVSPEAILALVQREGPEDQRLATLDHVMSCAACHREYQWLSAVNQAGLEAGGGRGAARRPWWRAAPLAMAASLLIAAGTALLLQRIMMGGPDTDRGGGEDVVLLAPAAGASGGGPLTFAWRPLPGASRYVLEVQRRDGTVAFADTTSDTTLTIVQPGSVLEESEYRWWVREVTDGAAPRSSPFRSLRFGTR